MQLTPDGLQLVIDARKHKIIDIPLTSFVLNVGNLLSSHTQAEWRLPAPDKIHGQSHAHTNRIQTSHLCVPGVITSDDPRTPIDVWRHTVRNSWRIDAAEQHVYGLPIWLYCDDTSGNVSKKWNKHNSILFVLGGLPHRCTTQLHNVHFLSTSNIASLLEMMEQVKEVLK